MAGISHDRFRLSSDYLLAGLILLFQLTSVSTQTLVVKDYASKGVTGTKSSSMADGCGSATFVEVGSATSGSTAGTTVYQSQACGSASWAGNSPGHWYMVEGINGMIEASVCTGTDFDTVISVWTGDNCTDMKCIEGIDDSCGAQSHAMFMSYIGTNYTIFVHGFAGKTGSYTLTLADVTPSSSPSASPTKSPPPTPKPTGTIETPPPATEAPGCFESMFAPFSKLFNLRGNRREENEEGDNGDD